MKDDDCSSYLSLYTHQSDVRHGPCVSMRHRSMREDNARMLKLVLQNATTCTALDLADNLVEEMPQCLSRLPLLVALDLSRNRLCSLVSWEGKCQLLNNLLELHLDGNCIEELGTALTSATSLEHLSIANNKLKRFSGFETLL